MMDFDRTILVTHAGCMDGSTCAILFLAVGGKRENIKFVKPQHEHVEECLDSVLGYSSDYDEVLLVDVSVSLEYARNCASHMVQILDHHKAAIPLSEFEWCEIDKENLRSGAMMFFDWILMQDDDHRTRVRQYTSLVQAADDYDRWIKEIPESSQLATLHYFLGQKLFIDRFMRNSELDLTSQEQYAIDLQEEKKQEFISRAKKEVIVRSYVLGGRDVRIGFVAANDYQSELGNAIYEDLDIDVDVAVMAGLKSVSMRCGKDSPLDLSVVAKLNGGGGHAQAAGCPLGVVLGRDLIETVANKILLGGE